MLNEGQKVTTEWGTGTVKRLTGRSVTIAFDEGEFTTEINIAYGTPGYYRLTAANEPDETCNCSNPYCQV